MSADRLFRDGPDPDPGSGPSRDGDPCLCTGGGRSRPHPDCGWCDGTGIFRLAPPDAGDDRDRVDRREPPDWIRDLYREMLRLDVPLATRDYALNLLMLLEHDGELPTKPTVRYGGGGRTVKVAWARGRHKLVAHLNPDHPPQFRQVIDGGAGPVMERRREVVQFLRNQLGWVYSGGRVPPCPE